MRVAVRRRVLRFRTPMRTADGELAERELLELELHGRDGVVGRGEAAPLAPYDGVSLERAAAALEAHRAVLEEADDDAPRAAVLAACRALDPLPHALAAVDVALWDRAGRRAGRSLAALLAADPAESVAVNATLGAEDRAGAAAGAASALAAGYSCLKVKVGVGDDAGRLAAVQAVAGPRVALRVDANGAWSEADAVAHLRALAPVGLELAEEPVHGVEALRRVGAAVPEVPLAMDETGAPGSGATPLVCLKLGRSGGIDGLLADAAAARAAGSEVYLASTWDGPVGIAAALHAAAALGVARACGLATLGLFAGMEGALPVRGGRMAVPAGPGLGL